MSLFEALVADLEEQITNPTLDLNRVFGTGCVETCEVRSLGDGDWEFALDLRDGSTAKFSLSLARMRRS
jgi:hypothetical protein